VALGLVAPLGAAAFPAAAAGQNAPSPLGRFEPGVYRGRLGAQDIQVELLWEKDVEDSVLGSYFVFGEGARILLAGELEGAQLSMEESRNGRDVSGIWSGEVGAGGIHGVWRDADETQELPFTMTRVAPPAGALP
jgi:hypothetical protein